MIVNATAMAHVQLSFKENLEEIFSVQAQCSIASRIKEKLFSCSCYKPFGNLMPNSKVEISR